MHSTAEAFTILVHLELGFIASVGMDGARTKAAGYQGAQHAGHVSQQLAAEASACVGVNCTVTADRVSPHPFEPLTLLPLSMT